MKPTVGQVVHWHHAEGADPWPATISKVKGEEVQLTLFPPGTATLVSVHHALFSELPRLGYWTWPPK
jgi:hypothetical protein